MSFRNIEEVKKRMIDIDNRIKDVKEFDIVSEVSEPNGKSFYICKCPYCGNELAIQKWSFTTTGKKCSCGAVLRNRLAETKHKK